MEEIIKVDFELEGIAPIKMDKWLDLPQPKNEKGYMEQAKQKTYTDDENNLAIPANAIKASMRMASSEVGGKMQGKKNRQTIKAQVFIHPLMLSMGKKDYDEIVRDIAVRGTGDKVTRIPTYRPLIKEWTVSGVMTLFGVPLEFAKEVLQLAGMRYGLLGHRPEFGRFIVKKFEVNNGKK